MLFVGGNEPKLKLEKEGAIQHRWLNRDQEKIMFWFEKMVTAHVRGSGRGQTME